MIESLVQTTRGCYKTNFATDRNRVTTGISCRLLIMGVMMVGVLSGCAGRPPQVQQDWQPQALYGRVLENYRRLQSFRGEGPLTIESTQVRFSAPARILILKPDSIFIKVEAALGIDAGFFFADRRQFATFSPLENLYFHGETAKVRELTLFQMDLTYDEMMSGMVGAALPPFDSTFTLMRDGDLYRFDGKRRPQRDEEISVNGVTQYAAAELDTAAWRVTYWVNPERGVVVKAEERDANGDLYARQEFKRFRQVRGVWLPQLIQMQRPVLKERLTIFYNHVEVNSKMATAEFVINVPKNAKRVDLSAPNHFPEMMQPLPKNP
ncbi:MAG: hypothetical protein ALAOOOJD_01220 [bacterium]|nr:hypothetical protein [bacterium]